MRDTEKRAKCLKKIVKLLWEIQKQAKSHFEKVTNVKRSKSYLTVDLTLIKSTERFS